jgi:hypothetical protein
VPISGASLSHGHISCLFIDVIICCIEGVADVAEMADTDEASAKCTLTVAECTSKPATASNVATSSTSRPSKGIFQYVNILRPKIIF